MKVTLPMRMGVTAGVLGLLVACNLPWMAAAPESPASNVAATVAALKTAIAETGTAGAVRPPPATEAPSATVTLPPAPTPTAGKPVVSVLALCWTGPGNAYPVVSSVQVGTEVKVLGVGSIAGWLVIENPRYRDSCWIEVKNLKLDPYFSTAGLKIYNPPPTPGPSATPVPSPTP